MAAQDEVDHRIVELKSHVASNDEPSPVEYVLRMLKNDRSPIVIGDSMCFNDGAIAAHILVESIFAPKNFASDPLSQQIKEAKTHLKELCKNGDMALPLLGSMERYMLLSDAANNGRKEVMKVLIEMFNEDVISDDPDQATALFHEWYETPNGSKTFGQGDEDATLIRTLAEPFIEWLDAGEESEDEEIDVGY
eukprot:CAMPEP_0185767974 /NCGR_PEP_ID=MMETSP1174-20130828/46248_1 /TAXON_ID=35687 /ORGANISM="Dictyocha speculum, Strain CCMP1381" /LENGTH=192 /DNA_ID=CAMNT_0028452405 /DNA_START=31 /DNA_END=609 /DNA_ORIENTATION=+